MKPGDVPLKLALAPIRFYRYFLSPLMPGRCRFYPSCSAYAEQALMTHGVFRGGFLTLLRLLRCHPWNPGGHDPVPAARDSLYHRKR